MFVTVSLRYRGVEVYGTTVHQLVHVHISSIPEEGYTDASLACCTHCHTPTPLHQLLNVMQRGRGRRRRPCICGQLSTAVFIYICIYTSALALLYLSGPATLILTTDVYGMCISLHIKYRLQIYKPLYYLLSFICNY